MIIVYVLMDYDSLFNQIRSRNELQTYPYSEIYNSSYHLWLKYTRLDAQREELRHQLALIEHEGAELINKGDSSLAIDHFKKRLAGLQIYHNNSEDAPHNVPLTNLSRTIYDQKKLISHQNEELKLMKSELNAAIERNVDLDAELKKVSQDLFELKKLSNLPPPPSSI